MALLSINPTESFQYFVTKANQELGLSLKISYNGIEYSNSLQSIEQFWRQNKVKFRLHPAIFFTRTDLLPLLNHISIDYLEKQLNEILGFDFEFYYEQKRVKKELKICDYLKEQNQIQNLEKLIHLNNLLRKLTENIQEEINETKDFYQIKGKSTNKNYDSDFEIEISITYHLSQSDPLYNSKCDNIIFSFENMTTYMNSQEFNEFYITRTFPKKNNVIDKIENQCYLFYWLTEHIEVSDICRIGEIWSDFKFINQKFISI